MALFCAAIRRDSVSLLKCLFLSHVKDFSREMFISRLKRPLSWCFFLIIKGIRTIVFIFIDISTTSQSICPPAFFRCLPNSRTFMELELRPLLNPRGGGAPVRLAITGYKC